MVGVLVLVDFGLGVFANAVAVLIGSDVFVGGGLLVVSVAVETMALGVADLHETRNNNVRIMINFFISIIDIETHILVLFRA